MAKDKTKAQDKIRVHNQGKREYTIPPSKKGGKNRMLQPGRAIEIEKDLAKKMITAYPRDLIEFDSLVSGEKKNLSRDNARLESENETFREKIESLESVNQKLKENADPDVQPLKDRITELEKEAGDPNERVPGGFQEKEVKTLKGEKESLENRILDLEIFIENSGLKVPVVNPSADEVPEDKKEG